MPDSRPPQLILTSGLWTYVDHPSSENPWTLEQQLEHVKASGFDAISTNATGQVEELRGLCQKFDLRFSGLFFLQEGEDVAEKIETQLRAGNGPINCQAGRHDTSLEVAVGLIKKLNRESEKRDARVYLEVHRGTCTETPEKTYAIADAYEKQTGKQLLLNFDYSHPGIVKHLECRDFAKRLIERPDLLQISTLWHCRPFNGHHCQVPVTDGKGSFSPEYEAFRPFIRDVFSCWLKGPRPTNEFWVVPELGPRNGYGLSCFPSVVEDAVVLGNDLRSVWSECLKEVS